MLLDCGIMYLIDIADGLLDVNIALNRLESFLNIICRIVLLRLELVDLWLKVYHGQVQVYYI